MLLMVTVNSPVPPVGMPTGKVEAVSTMSAGGYVIVVATLEELLLATLSTIPGVTMVADAVVVAVPATLPAAKSNVSVAVAPALSDKMAVRGLPFGAQVTPAPVVAAAVCEELPPLKVQVPQMPERKPDW